jgi:hypothetical protein
MNLKPIALAFVWGFGALALQASDLTPEVTARFLKVIATTSGQTRIACQDGAVKTALEAQGMPVEAGAGIVWCTSVTEARMQKQLGKLVVVGRRDLVAMACIVLEEEGGRPRLVLNTTNIRTCKITLGDALMRIGEKL